MSSYFDTMESCLGRGDLLVQLVYKQYSRYLDTIAEECLGWEQDRLSEIIHRFWPLEERARKLVQIPDLADGQYEFGQLLRELHDLAHDLGRARIRLRSGQYAGDNPGVVV